MGDALTTRRALGGALAAAILVTAAALRFARLGFFSYGLDEILQTYWMAGSWDFFWDSLRFDAGNPPLAYLVARATELLAPSDAARKIPGVLFGIAGVGVFASLIARRAGPRAGLIAGILLAFAPFHVRYSQELRPYPLALLTLPLALLALDAFLRRPAVGRLAACFVSFVVAVYTFYLSQIVLALAAAAILVEDSFSEDLARRRVARRFLTFSPVFAGAVFLAYLPWWPIQLAAASRPPVVDVASPFTAARVVRLLSFFFFAPWDGEPLRAGGFLYAALIVAGVVICIRSPGRRFVPVWSVGG
ncbi:MAG TPA: glycosyltransferase family 39 protein, partial [Thermoanaerobaculia bacterium]